MEVCRAGVVFVSITSIIYRMIILLNGVTISVVKRSADLHTEAKFAQFSGKGITEFDIINLEEAQAYEDAHKNTH